MLVGGIAGYFGGWLDVLVNALGGSANDHSRYLPIGGLSGGTPPRFKQCPKVLSHRRHNIVYQLVGIS